MKRLNHRFLAIVLISVVAMGALMFVIHRFQMSRQTVFFGDQARIALHSGKYDEAIRLYQLSLRLNPQDRDLLLGVAEAYERTGQYQKAYESSQRAQQVIGQDRQNQLRLVRTGLMMGRYGDVIASLQPLIETAEINTPNDSPLVPLEGDTRSELHALLGRALVGNRETAAAVDAFQKAIDAGEAPLDVYARLASLQDNELRDADAAKQTLDRMVSENAGNAKARIIRGQRWLRQSELVQAESDAEHAMKLAREAVHTKVVDADASGTQAPLIAATEFASEVALAQDQFGRSTGILSDAIEAFPNHATFYRMAYMTLIQQREVTSDPAERVALSNRAVKILTTGIARAPSDSTLLWILAADHLENDRLEDARRVTDQLGQLGYTAPLVNYLDARLEAAAGDVYSAALRMEKVRSDVVESPDVVRLVDLTLADLYEKMGDFDRQIAVLRRLVGQDTFSLPARERLAFAFLRVGRIDEAVAEYRLITDRPGVPIQAPLNFARLLLMQNLGRDPESRDWSQLISVIDQLATEPTLAVDAALLRAEVFAASDKLDLARQTLVDAIEMDGKNERLWSARIALEVAQRDFLQAEKWISEANDEVGDLPAIRYATATALLSQSPDDADEQISRLAEIPDDWTEDQSFDLARSMVPLLISAALYEDADRLASLAAQLRPDEVGARLQLIQVAFQAGRSDQLREHLAALRRVSGQDSRWYYGSALAISLEASPAESSGVPRESGGVDVLGVSRDTMLAPVSEDQNRRAQEFLAEAAVLRPDWNLIPAFSAYLHDRAGNTEAAIVKYNQAVELGWRNSASIRRLIQLLTQRERYGEADSVIRRLRSGNEPFTSEMSRIASEISAEMADLRRAVTLAEEAARQSGSSEDYLWLGQLSEILDDGSAAEAAYRSAMAAGAAKLVASSSESVSEKGNGPKDELKGTAANTVGAAGLALPTLAWIGFLKRNARLGEAKSALEDLEAIIGNVEDDAARLLLADGYARIDAIDQAARVLQSVSSESLRGLEQFRQYHQIVSASRGDAAAIDRLRQWLNPSTGESPLNAEVAGWARRTLALSLASGGDPNVYAEAKSLLDQNRTMTILSTDPTGIDANTVKPSAVQAELTTRVDSLAAMEDRRASAIVDAIFLGGNQPEVALSQFDSLIRDGWQPALEDQFTIGQLAAGDGDWTRGRRLMLPILSDDELRQPIHVKTYIRLLLDNNDAGEASLWINRLQQSGIRDAATARLTADVLRRRGNHDRLLRLLTAR